MISTAIVLWFLALGTEATPAVVGEKTVLIIDPCVEVDEATVREVMDLELRDARAREETLPTSVSVRCAGDAQEIRVEPWASPKNDGVRTIQLSPVADTTPAARQARSRELALAIAEIIRRRETAPPPAGETPARALPPPSVSTLVTPPAPPVEALRGRWQLGIQPTYDYFSGGRIFAGVDLLVGARLGRWFLVELRAGGRAGSDQTLPGGRLSVRAATVGAGAGVLYWPDSSSVGCAFMLRAQEYLVQFRAEAPGQDGARTALLGAFVLAAEPRFIVALTRRFALEAGPAVGFPPRGIVVRTQGTQTQSVSGLLLSASLVGVLTF